MQRGRPKKRTREQREAVTESQQVQALSSHLTKPKGGDEEINKFRGKVKGDRLNLKALLEQRVQQAENREADRRVELSTLVTEALTKPSKATNRKPANFKNTKIVGNALYSSAVEIDAACRKMFTEYHELDSMIENLSGENMTTITDQWALDVKERERLLRLGHKMAVRDVKKVLGMELDEADVKREKSVKELNMELSNGLRYAERGVKRMVKCLPRDEDEREQLHALQAAL